MRVLIATNDQTFTRALVLAYAARGWEVATGVDNLSYCAASYDLVHLHWPEELARWQKPDQGSRDQIASVLDWWRKKAKLLATVHNLLPHGREASEPDHDLYQIVYRAADVIAHFSRHSLQCVTQTFPEVEAHKHVVHRPFLFNDLKSYGRGRDEARRCFGIRDEEFAILAFGAFRHNEELRLFWSGVASAKVAGKRVVFAARPPPAGRLRRVFRRVRSELGDRFGHNISFGGAHIPNKKVALLFEAADAVVIARFPPHLNSGILPLAMTFGTPVVAPKYGIYEEYLVNTENELYEPGDAHALSNAIERLAMKDRRSAISANHKLALSWGWPAILDRILPEVSRVQLAKMERRY